MASTLRLDPSVCDGFGFCCEILPEMIGRDEWGFPVISDKEIPDELAGAAKKAVHFCPRRALAVVAVPVRRIPTRR
jgi:ferredoxin